MSMDKPKANAQQLGTEIQSSAGLGMFQRSHSMIDKKRSPLPPPRTRLKHQHTMSTASNSHPHSSGHHGSDSDASNAETNSISGESGITEQPKELVQFSNTGALARKKSNRRRGSEWEILEGLKDGQRYDNKPEKYTGYLHKKRKWPLKGWHKRYFVVEKGLLVYAKNPTDITRGKLHGSVDIGLSVISTKEKRKRLDIDAEEFIYHLKAKTIETFTCWVQKLRIHRLYRQHLLTYGIRDLPLIRAPIAMLDEIDSPGLGRSKHPLTPPEVISRDGSLTRGLKPMIGALLSPGGRLAAWLVNSTTSFDSANKELTQVQQNINQLMRILDNIDALTSLNSTSELEQVNEGFSPSVKKDRKKFGLRKKKSSKGSSVDLTAAFTPNPDNASPLSVCSFTGLSSSPQPVSNQQLSASNNSLTTAVNSTMATSLPIPSGVTRPHSLPGADHLQAPMIASSDRQIMSGTPDHQLRDDFAILAKDVVGSLKSVLVLLVSERDRFKTAVDSEAASASSNHNSSLGNVVTTLRGNLHQALQQNQDLRSRLAKVHETSDISDISLFGPTSEVTGRPFNQSLSYSSSCVSASEFYDAEDIQTSHNSPAHKGCPDLIGHNNLEQPTDDEETGNGCDLDADLVVPGEVSDTSSEAGSLTSEEGSVSSENSELGTEYNADHNSTETENVLTPYLTGRRTRLPVPRPDTEGLSLWNLLCKNIGKDLSQISMPVALNEPLNMLQKLCEELEYSELLDKAAELDDPLERMVYIAAFAVSSYASSYFRAGNKPFNPLLGETYECIREDKGFRFISEQVSHHPPVSVCHAESKNFIFWQDARIKTKFWGKSMEFQPIGLVNVKLPKTGDHYQWNKLTTCVHNLFSDQRWVDQYGELKITDLVSGIVCKMTFVKASYWSAKRHEIFGVVTNSDGKVTRKLFGKWSEALYCGIAPSAKCIWRPGTMPEDYELYYGFTRFAIELNELGPESAFLPVTDTRLRPDQRALEMGDLEAAETLKLQLEQSQRDRRKNNEQEQIVHEPRWFSKKNSDLDETWEYNNKYWETRKNPGFSNCSFESLW